MDGSGTRTWEIHDALGSVRQHLAADGSVLPGGSYAYTPFGVVASGNTPAPFGFTGELHSQGLVYLRARWYDPSVGTFTSRDPFAGINTVPNTLHPYQYAYAAPTMWTDPSGLCSEWGDDYCFTDIDTWEEFRLRYPYDYYHPLEWLVKQFDPPLTPAQAAQFAKSYRAFSKDPFKYGFKSRTYTEAELFASVFLGQSILSDQPTAVFEQWICLQEKGSENWSKEEVELALGLLPLVILTVGGDDEIRGPGGNVPKWKYSPTPKHQSGGWGTLMDLDDAVASDVLNKGILAPNGKQVYSYHNGKLYEFQPDNVGGYHGYPVPGNEVPPSVLKQMRDQDIITKAQYKKMIKGK